MTTESPSDLPASVVDAAEVDPARLTAFLGEAFGFGIQEFLSLHADWWHRGPGHVWVGLVDDEVAGYRAYIPTVLFFEGTELPGIWGIDLFVLPRFRGLGLQKLLDERLVEASGLVMSFPGDLGATIYAKQGYIIRSDVEVFEISLAPKPVAQTAPGVLDRVRFLVSRGLKLGFGGTVRQTLLRARARGVRGRSAGYQPRRTHAVYTPDPQALEALFLRHVDHDVATTLRSADHLRWRYLEAPYHEDLVFYLGETNGQATQCAIVRYLPPAREARVLDLFGDLHDEDALADLVHAILRDALDRGVDRVITVGSSPELTTVLRRAGFRRRELRSFRWRCADAALHDRFATMPCQWTLGDSNMDSRT